MTVPLIPSAFPGSTVRLTVRFTNPETGALEPITAPVTFIVTPPSGAAVTGAGVLQANGSYQFAWVPVISGRHVVYVRSSGATPAVAEEEFVIRQLQTVV